MSHHPLAAVFVMHRPQLKRTAQRIVGDADRAEDLLHDAYLKATACPRATPAEPLAYCHRIVRNLAIDLQRRCSLEGDLFGDECLAQDVGCPCASPERSAMGRQHLQLLAEAVAALPERCRRAFELHQLEGRPLREVAADLKLSLATTHALLQQALHRCRAALREG